MEVQPIIEHKATGEWMEGKPQSVKEVLEENYPLVRFKGRNDLPRSGQPVRDIRGQVSGSAHVTSLVLI